MKMPGTSFTAVAKPMSIPRGHRGRSTTQSKMQHAIKGMPTWPKRRWSSTGEIAAIAPTVSTSAIGAARPKRSSSGAKHTRTTANRMTIVTAVQARLPVFSVTQEKGAARAAAKGG